MLDLSDKRSLYNIYAKKKSNGKKRMIYAPKPELKSEQMKLAQRLDKIYNPPDYVFGYVKGRNTADLANHHIGKDWVITIDIENFFPSITAWHMNMWELTEYEIELATYNGKCVQGSPCSPVISNMIMLPFDFACHFCFRRDNITYTRYSDDIQLSGYGKPSWKSVKLVEYGLQMNHMQLNRRKVKFMFKNQRQEVLGLCVNDKVSVNRKVRSQLKFRANRGMLTERDKGMISYISSVS